MDAAAAGAALALILGAGALDASGRPPFVIQDPWPGATGLLRLDAMMARPYDSRLDALSAAFVAAAALTPAAALFLPSDSRLSLGLGYVEAAALAYGLKELGKSLVARTRPYAFLDAEARSDDGADRSFPSGHSAMAFTGAAYAAVAVYPRLGRPGWRWPLTIGSFLAASAAATLRVASGEHYLSDAFAGAAIGALAGAIVPLARSALGRVGEANAGADVRVSPTAPSPGLALVIRY